MLTGRKQVVLADVESVQNVLNGDRTKRVTRAKALAATVELVGVNTAQLGQVQGFRLTNSVEIDRVQYDGENLTFLNARAVLNVERSGGKLVAPDDFFDIAERQCLFGKRKFSEKLRFGKSFADEC